MFRRREEVCFVLAFPFASILICGLAQAQAQPPAGQGQVIVTPPPTPGAPPPAGAPAPPPPPTVTPPPPAGASPTPETNPPAGYIPGKGFVIQSEDTAYKLRVGLQAGYRFEPVYNDGSFQARNTFFVLRPIIAGNLFKEWIHFWTSAEFAANPPFLLDSYVELFPWKEFGLRIGQQFTPYDRHEYFGPQEILFPDWAAVSEYFWPGRDKGVTAMGTLADQLEYWVGAYSGTPLRQFNALAGNYVFQARVTWSPMGPMGSTEFPYIVSEGPAPVRVSGTLQGYYGKIQSAIENVNPSTFSFEEKPSGLTNKEGAGGADFWVQGSWFTFYVDGTLRRTTPQTGPSFTSIGIWGQFGVMVIDKTMDVAARVNWLNPSFDLSNDQFYSLEGQVAYYISHSPALVLKGRYALGHQSTPGMQALGSVPLVIAVPGTTQLGTLQLNLAF